MTAPLTPEERVAAFLDARDSWEQTIAPYQPVISEVGHFTRTREFPLTNLTHGDLRALLALVASLRAEVLAVRALHLREASLGGVVGCCTCRQPWPCDTIRAIGETQ